MGTEITIHYNDLNKPDDLGSSMMSAAVDGLTGVMSQIKPYTNFATHLNLFVGAPMAAIGLGMKVADNYQATGNWGVSWVAGVTSTIVGIGTGAAVGAVALAGAPVTLPSLLFITGASILVGAAADQTINSRLIEGWDKKAQHCFPSFTPVLLVSGATALMCEIRCGETILAFDASTDMGRGALVARRVTKVFRNVTTGWIELDLGVDPVTGERRLLTCTPGHHFLDEFGNFPTIAEMLLRGGGMAANDNHLSFTGSNIAPTDRLMKAAGAKFIGGAYVV